MAKEVKTVDQVAEELKADIASAEKATIELKTAITDAEKINVDTADLKAQLEEQKTKNEELEGKMSKIAKRQGEIDLQGTKVEEPQSLEMAFKSVLNSQEWKDAAQEVLSEKRHGFSMEVKVPTTASVVTPVNSTQVLEGIGTTGRAPASLLDLYISSEVSPGKNRIAYREASFIDNSGYVEELAVMTTANTATMQEKYRLLAKIGSFMPFSSEMLEDSGELVSWAMNEGTEAIRYRLNAYLESGTGADGGANANKIYGLKTTGVTAFNATTSGLADKVVDPTIADLVKACIMQIKKQGKGRFIPTHVVLSIDDLAIMDTMKDKNGQPLVIRGYDGTPRLHGLTVVEDIERTPGQGYVVTQRTLQLKEKRTLSMELERNANKDGYTFYLRWRGQALVRNIDKLGNVSFDTLTDLAELEKPVA